MSKIYKLFFPNLPESIEQHILEFCIDKRLNLKNVMEQFFKGGFCRINLNAQRYVNSQKSLCEKIWTDARPGVCPDPSRLYQMVGRIKYENSWDLKKCRAVVELITPNGRTMRKWSGRAPVSKWLKCIKKFETAQPMLATEYLCKKRKFGVKGVSEFYVKKRKVAERKRLRAAEEKKAKQFWFERKAIKLTEQLSKYGFTENQTVRLSFSSNHWQGLRFFKGICTFYLENGCRIPEPRGKNRFEPNIVDKCHNTFKIRVKFADGEIRYYIPERLLARIQFSKNEFEEQTALNRRLVGANQRATNNIIQHFTLQSTYRHPRYIHANTFTIQILGQTYFTITVNKVENVLFNESGNLMGVYDNGLIQTCMDQYKITAPVIEDGYITLDSNTPTTMISGIIYFKIPYGGFDEVLINQSGVVAGVLQNGQIMEVE